MGGKISMLVALRHPELVERLVVVDVAPVPYDHADEFDGYIKAMRAIDLAELARRAEADAALQEAVPDPMVRGFLLQSLRREDDHWRWLLNLELLGRDLDSITDWPEDRLEGSAPYDGRVLWVGGALSRYLAPEHVAAMDRWFPRNRKVIVKDAGHWVHSEQPQVFIEVLRRFLAQD
jgi:pimeloyl-ACP methyl ester carboxylesterase